MKNALIALWFFLPAGLGNMAPIFAAKIPGLRKWQAPIDGGKTFRGKRLLGDHKTWRGLAAGIVISTVVFWLQSILAANVSWAGAFTDSIGYSHIPVLLLGPLFGLGALGGDAIKSFFKRQAGIKSGKNWFPFDQIDYIIGGVVITLPLVQLSLLQYIWVVIIWLVLHLISSYIGYLLHLKERPI